VGAALEDSGDDGSDSKMEFERIESDEEEDGAVLKKASPGTADDDGWETITK
jgi:hypothetical protein